MKKHRPGLGEAVVRLVGCVALFIAAHVATVQVLEIVRGDVASVQRTDVLPGGSASAAWMASDGVGIGSEATVPDGPELILVLVGSSTCGFSRPDAIGPPLMAAKASLLQEGQRRGLGVRVVGVATDRAPVAGMQYLEEVGEFDEMLSGPAWSSVGFGKTLRYHLPDAPATPQILIFERDSYRASAISSSSAGAIDVSGENGADPVGGRLVLRHHLEGLSALTSWSEAGARIPEAMPPEGG